MPLIGRFDVRHLPISTRELPTSTLETRQHLYVTETPDADLIAEMTSLFAAYGDLWNSQNFSRLKELWDHDEERPFYLPEEQADWRTGWASVDAYWAQDPDRPFIEAMFVRYSVSDAKYLAADVAQVIGWLHNDMLMVGPAPAMGGDCRFTAVLRRRPEGWRIVSYVEAQTTALALVQQMYEKNVSPEFDEFRRALADKRTPRSSRDV